MNGTAPRKIIFASVAVAWTLLVWLNWFDANPLSPRKLANSLLAYGTVRPGPAMAAWAGHLKSLAVAALLALAARGAGRPLARLLVAGMGVRAGLSAYALGAGAIGLAALGAGLAGLAFTPLAWAGAAAAAANGLRGLKFSSPARPAGAGSAALLAALALGLWTVLLGNLAPEGAFDSLGHHLLHPQLHAAHHKICALPWHFLAGNPALLEMQYMVAILLTGSAATAKLLHFGWGVLALCTVYAWARESLEENWALFAAAVLLLLPYVQLVMMWAYVDMGFAALLLLALWSVRSPRRLGLAAALAGLAVGVKITGVFAPALVLALAVSGGVRVRALAWPALACLAAALPWAARNLGLTGNPVAPLLPGIFPTVWWGPENYARYNAELRSYAPGFGGGILPAFSSLFSVPWGVTVRNSGVLDDGGGMGGWFLWALPLLLLFGRGTGGAVPALLFGGYFLLWLFIPRQARYLLPAWGLGALACAHAVRGLVRSGSPARYAGYAAMAALALNAVAALPRQHYIINPLPAVFGNETAEEYLARGLPGKPYSVRAQRWMRENPGEGRLLLLSEFRSGLYWGPRSVFQSAFDTSLAERFARESATPTRLAVKMRQMNLRRAVYAATAGFPMAAEYGTFRFDPGSAARWREYWVSRASFLHDQDDSYIFYSLDGRPGVGEEVPARGFLPGLDEQWLAQVDRVLRRAETDGSIDRVLPGLERDLGGIARATGSACAWERLGIARLRAGRHGPAREALKEAERRGRRTATLYAGLGYLDWQAGEAGRAMESLRKALKLKPDLGEARRNLVNILITVGRPGEAAEVAAEGLKLDPSDEGLKRAVFGR